MHAAQKRQARELRLLDGAGPVDLNAGRRQRAAAANATVNIMLGSQNDPQGSDSSMPSPEDQGDDGPSRKRKTPLTGAAAASAAAAAKRRLAVNDLSAGPQGDPSMQALAEPIPRGKADEFAFRQGSRWVSFDGCLFGNVSCLCLRLSPCFHR